MAAQKKKLTIEQLTLYDDLSTDALIDKVDCQLRRVHEPAHLHIPYLADTFLRCTIGRLHAKIAQTLYKLEICRQR
jgi:hypothetical protein